MPTRTTPIIDRRALRETPQMKTMREWVRRREAAHKPWTADELWNRIKANWPTAGETEWERIFQDATK